MTRSALFEVYGGGFILISQGIRYVTPCFSTRPKGVFFLLSQTRRNGGSDYVFLEDPVFFIYCSGWYESPTLIPAPTFLFF